MIPPGPSSALRIEETKKFISERLENPDGTVQTKLNLKDLKIYIETPIEEQRCYFNEALIHVFNAVWDWIPGACHPNHSSQRR